MTTPASAPGIGGRPPSPDERAAADQLHEILAERSGDDARIRILGGDGQPVEVTLAPGLSALLLELLRSVRDGEAVALLRIGEELSAQQAADILDLSRSDLLSLLDEGEMAYTLAGRHRRIKAAALFAYKEARDARRAAAMPTGGGSPMRNGARGLRGRRSSSLERVSCRC